MRLVWVASLQALLRMVQISTFRQRRGLFRKAVCLRDVVWCHHEKKISACDQPVDDVVNRNAIQQRRNGRRGRKCNGRNGHDHHVFHGLQV